MPRRDNHKDPSQSINQGGKRKKHQSCWYPRKQKRKGKTKKRAAGRAAVPSQSEVRLLPGWLCAAPKRKKKGYAELPQQKGKETESGSYLQTAAFLKIMPCSPISTAELVTLLPSKALIDRKSPKCLAPYKLSRCRRFIHVGLFLCVLVIIITR